LAEKASWLLDNPDAAIRIEGHCDERGTNEYNIALGERRANSARKYLINAGVEAHRIFTISYGEEKPLDPGHNETAWAKNRRDHFLILSE
jgi:peptidoglycan-associated lipoprotein